MQQKIGAMGNNLHYAFYYRFSALSIHQKCGIHKQSVYEKLNISPKPKKPLTPFFQFLALVRPTLTKEFPDVKNTELVRIAAKRWSSVDSTLKEKLTKQFHEESTQYKKLKEEYQKQLTPDQKAAIVRAEQYELDLKEERRTKKKSMELGKPKRPVSVFFRYLQSRSNEKTKYPGVKEWVKAVSEEWKKLSPEVKAKYEEERKREQESWIQQLKQWEEKMIKDGNVDVDEACPGSNLITPVLKVGQDTVVRQRNSVKELTHLESAIKENVTPQIQKRYEKLAQQGRKVKLGVGIDSTTENRKLVSTQDIVTEKKDSDHVKKFSIGSKIPNVLNSSGASVTNNVSSVDIDSGTVEIKYIKGPEEKQLEEFAQKIENNVLESRNEKNNNERQERWWEKIINKIKK